MLSQVGFNRVPEKVPEKVWEASVQSQVRFNRVPERVPEKVWEAIWCKARSGSTGFRRRFRRRSGRLRCRVNRVPEKVPEQVWEASVQSRVRFNRICGHLTHGTPAEVCPALGLADASERLVKIKRCGCWGCPRSLFSYFSIPTGGLPAPNVTDGYGQESVSQLAGAQGEALARWSQVLLHTDMPKMGVYI